MPRSTCSRRTTRDVADPRDLRLSASFPEVITSSALAVCALDALSSLADGRCLRLVRVALFCGARKQQQRTNTTRKSGPTPFELPTRLARERRRGRLCDRLNGPASGEARAALASALLGRHSVDAAHELTQARPLTHEGTCAFPLECTLRRPPRESVSCSRLLRREDGCRRAATRASAT